MAEQIDLAAPLPSKGGTDHYKLIGLMLDWEHEKIVAYLLGDNGERRQVTWLKAEGAKTMMVALNKADLSNNSLHKRLLNKAIQDGKLSGTISGVPN